MKKITILFFLTIGIHSITIAQNKTTNQIAIDENSICHKWIFSDVINPKFTKKELEETKALLEGIFIEIRKDKTCLTSLVLELEGTWTLNLEEKYIIIEDERGSVKWKIHSLTKNEIQLSRNDAKQIIVFKTTN